MTATKALSHKEVVKQMMKKLKEVIAMDLPSVQNCTKYELAIKLSVYRNIIAPNFVPWMAYVWIQCGGEARKAFANNLLCEVSDDHPEMLERYVKQGVNYSNEARANLLAKSLKNLVAEVAQTVSNPDSVAGLLVAAGLENASLTFIRWMKKAGKKLGFKDYEYVDKHGKADIKHAKSLADAVCLQAQALGLSPNVLSQFHTLETVKDLLLGIFNAM